MQIATNKCYTERGKATKPTPMDSVCERGTGHFTSWLTMGYRVAAGAKAESAS